MVLLVVAVQIRLTPLAGFFFRLWYTVMLGLMGWVEYRAFRILSGEDEYAIDESLAILALVFGFSFVLTSGWLTVWRGWRERGEAEPPD